MHIRANRLNADIQTPWTLSCEERGEKVRNAMECPIMGA